MQLNKPKLIISIILTLVLFLPTFICREAKALFDSTYQQNYDVLSDSSILIFDPDERFKIKFKNIDGEIDVTKIRLTNIPENTLKIKSRKHKTMGSSSIHVVEVAESPEPHAGYMEFGTFIKDGDKHINQKIYKVRVVVKADHDCSPRYKPVCGIVTFPDGERYKVDFDNSCHLRSADAVSCENS